MKKLFIPQKFFLIQELLIILTGILFIMKDI
nr:MAG TPA: hypothetical protein [Caudoviricetes sp.]